MKENGNERKQKKRHTIFNGVVWPAAISHFDAISFDRISYCVVCILFVLNKGCNFEYVIR